MQEITKSEIMMRLKRHPLILDVGSFNGADGAAFCKLGATVHAFEPIGEITHTHENMTVYKCALSDFDGTGVMYVSNNICSSSMRAPKTHLHFSPKITFDSKKAVQCKPLDSFGFKDVDLIWADVNGAEEQFILGATETLKTTKYLYIEASDKELYAGQINIKQVLDLLKGWKLIGVYNDYERFCDLFLENSSAI